MQMAAQAAAGALGTMSGPCCEDFVLCAEPRAEGEASADSGTVQVQVTLLVLCLPDGQQGAGAPRGGLQAGAAPRFRVGPALPQPPRQQPAAPQRLPASSWNMLSAMAGGAAGNSGKAAAAPGSQQEGAQRGEQPGEAAQGQQPARSIPNFFGGGGKPRPQQEQQQQAGAASQPQAPAPAASSSSAAKPAAAQQRVPVQRAARAPQAAPRPAAADAAAPAEPQERRMTVGDQLVNSLTAQSLDLPPAVSPLACPRFARRGSFSHGCCRAPRNGRACLPRCPTCLLCHASLATHPARPLCPWLTFYACLCTPRHPPSRRRGGGRSTAATPPSTASSLCGRWTKASPGRVSGRAGCGVMKGGQAARWWEPCTCRVGTVRHGGPACPGAGRWAPAPLGGGGGRVPALAASSPAGHPPTSARRPCVSLQKRRSHRAWPRCCRGCDARSAST